MKAVINADIVLENGILRDGVILISDGRILKFGKDIKIPEEAEIIDAGKVMVELRSVKSENELACLREGYRIANIATEEVIKAIRPGMTELQMVGVAQKAVYEHGAEYEGLPMYVFSEASTRHAISRSCYREFQKGDIVQLNLSAKIDGYSAAIGYPICLGKLEGERRDIVQFCREHTDGLRSR